jgi:hypothetical protein
MIDSCPNRVLCTRCKFNIEVKTCFCIFLPAAIAAGKKIQATREAGGLLTSRMGILSLFYLENLKMEAG